MNDPSQLVTDYLTQAQWHSTGGEAFTLLASGLLMGLAFFSARIPGKAAKGVNIWGIFVLFVAFVGAVALGLGPIWSGVLAILGWFMGFSAKSVSASGSPQLKDWLFNGESSNSKVWNIIFFELFIGAVLIGLLVTGVNVFA